ncbi:anthranilate synthase component I [Priestia endophytica]|uniref:anthranilate synthase component I n=1 Tax=Priestia endophytica TaxID=135735 RepID=UPI002282FFE7|nr:anthranilate synthase component I [Priestia endophytica]MCY8234045.1 anthranilate synthase component I [Priestia endophytica]
MNILSEMTTDSQNCSYITSNNLFISRFQKEIDLNYPSEYLLPKLNTYKGGFFSSTFEYTGRYSRWDVGFINPPLEIRTKKSTFEIQSLNDRGNILIKYLKEYLPTETIEITEYKSNCISGHIDKSNFNITNEGYRTKQPSIFDLLRKLKSLFFTDDSFLGLYGSFGYDLIFEFEDIEYEKERSEEQKDIHLYLPDELMIVDHEIKKAYTLSYEFETDGMSTAGLERSGEIHTYNHSCKGSVSPYKEGYYADLVRKASNSFIKGDLFEVVPTQLLSQTCTSSPSEVFCNLQKINPSPYGFLINIGSEFLVGCSPEMYVRVENGTVETCPISGTIKRGSNPIEDAEQIKKLLNSSKEEAELTMCTDVDRNDKSRVCIPGTVRVVGRRQIETYSHLLHTVDHVKGELQNEFDEFDAFMTHMWAVTVTGAPKLEALRWIEKNEETPREWYGGAIGWFSFNGNLHTGLTLRTINMKDGIAKIRVGATLLYDSIPEEEEQETLVKAQALIEALNMKEQNPEEFSLSPHTPTRNVLLIDHEDSFVHTLSSYMRKLNANVTVCRSSYARQLLREDNHFDLVILSPGPGQPSRFNLQETIGLCLEKKIPIFGVCLGLQGIVEYFGGTLGILSSPYHGKKSVIHHDKQSTVLKDISSPFTVGRYHSIYAKEIPNSLDIICLSEDDIVMGVQHKSLPIAAVQFHPESIMTLEGENGMKILKNTLDNLDMSK